MHTTFPFHEAYTCRKVIKIATRKLLQYNKKIAIFFSIQTILFANSMADPPATPPAAATPSPGASGGPSSLSGLLHAFVQGKHFTSFPLGGLNDRYGRHAAVSGRFRPVLRTGLVHVYAVQGAAAWAGSAFSVSVFSVFCFMSTEPSISFPSFSGARSLNQTAAAPPATTPTAAAASSAAKSVRVCNRRFSLILVAIS